MSQNIEIMGVGLSTLDVLISARELPTWERGCGAQGYTMDGGGMVATAMVAAQKLGARTAYAGLAGRDELALAKLAQLRKEGVDVTGVVEATDSEPHMVLVFVDPTGERVFMGMDSIDGMPLLPEHLDREAITAAQLLHLDIMFPQAALQAAEWMQAAGKPVLLDASKVDPGGTVPEGKRALVPHVDYLVCGSGFAQAVSGLDDLDAACRALLKLGPKVVTQTLGEEGSYTVTSEGESFSVPAFPTQVVDTTGAGDVFHGAYSVGLVRGWPLEAIVRFATAVSALKCQAKGGQRAAPRLDAVIAFLEAQGVDTAVYREMPLVSDSR